MRRTDSPLAGVAAAAFAVALFSACRLPLSHTCVRSQDCLTGTCIEGVCTAGDGADAGGDAGGDAGDGRAPDVPDAGDGGDTVDAMDAGDARDALVDVPNAGDGGDAVDAMDAGDAPDAPVDVPRDTGDAPVDVPADVTVAGDAADADAVTSSPGCGPAWAEWPMPNPPALTGTPSDPRRSLPNPQSYDTSAPDVVVDNVTHLVWQKQMSAAPLTWLDAQSYCQGLSLGGLDDWRLPSRIELVSLNDFSGYQAGNLNNNAFPDHPTDYVWTCTHIAGNPLEAWIVDFTEGTTIWGETLESHRVRCVSGARTPTPPPARYQTFAPDEVLDVKTGLTWRASVSPTKMSWGDAFEYCQGMGQGWRLPSLTELQTLIDQSQLTSAVDTTAFPDRPNGFFWTSSWFGADNPNSAWFVSIGEGNSHSIDLTELLYARCVR